MKNPFAVIILIRYYVLCPSKMYAFVCAMLGFFLVKSIGLFPILILLYTQTTHI